MQTLVFNSTEKTVQLFEGSLGGSKLIQTFTDASTVKCSELGFYEVFVKTEQGTIPVFRAPIMNTNMLIVK
jgi:hypothetical protein